MNCSVCNEIIKYNIYKCWYKHYYHIKCFNKLNTDKCIICSNYISIYKENVVSYTICDKLIKQGELTGFTNMQTNKFKEEYNDNTIRNNTACVIQNKLLINKLKNILKDIMPKIDEIYDYLRFTKYKVGNSMVRHLDGKFNNNFYNSNYTLIIFLSDAEGGDIRVYNNDNTYYDIKPKKGAICIINQNTEHEVLPVLNGIKYNIRTDLLELKKLNITSAGTLTSSIATAAQPNITQIS